MIHFFMLFRSLILVSVFSSLCISEGSASQPQKDYLKTIQENHMDTLLIGGVNAKEGQTHEFWERAQPTDFVINVDPKAKPHMLADGFNWREHTQVLRNYHVGQSQVEYFNVDQLKQLKDNKTLKKVHYQRLGKGFLNAQDSIKTVVDSLSSQGVFEYSSFWVGKTTQDSKNGVGILEMIGAKETGKVPIFSAPNKFNEHLAVFQEFRALEEIKEDWGSYGENTIRRQSQRKLQQKYGSKKTSVPGRVQNLSPGGISASEDLTPLLFLYDKSLLLNLSTRYEKLSDNFKKGNSTPQETFASFQKAFEKAFRGFGGEYKAQTGKDADFLKGNPVRNQVFLTTKKYQDVKGLDDLFKDGNYKNNHDTQIGDSGFKGSLEFFPFTTHREYFFPTIMNRYYKFLTETLKLGDLHFYIDARSNGDEGYMYSFRVIGTKGAEPNAMHILPSTIKIEPSSTSSSISTVGISPAGIAPMTSTASASTSIGLNSGAAVFVAGESSSKVSVPILNSPPVEPEEKDHSQTLAEALSSTQEVPKSSSSAATGASAPLSSSNVLKKKILKNPTPYLGASGGAPIWDTVVLEASFLSGDLGNAISAKAEELFSSQTYFDLKKASLRDVLFSTLGNGKKNSLGQVLTTALLQKSNLTSELMASLVPIYQRDFSFDQISPFVQSAVKRVNLIQHDLKHALYLAVEQIQTKVNTSTSSSPLSSEETVEQALKMQKFWMNYYTLFPSSKKADKEEEPFGHK